MKELGGHATDNELQTNDGRGGERGDVGDGGEGGGT